MPPVHRVPVGATSHQAVTAERLPTAYAAIAKGLAYLRSRQTPSGAWMNKAEVAPTNEPSAVEPVAVAVTGLGLKAFMQMQAEGTPRDPAAERALACVLRAHDGEGEFGGGAIANYVQASVISGLASVQDAASADAIRLAIERLKSMQWDESEGLTSRQDWYGGAGYGRHGRPDLSNTQLMLDALHDAGVSPDDPAVQRALSFVSRTQNLRASNSASWSTAGANDGGFIYTPSNGGESFASETAGEGRHGELLPADAARSLRSYGSMTYAGFKSLLYAGLGPDDPRVKAAFDWIRRHYTFEENPGLGRQGLYYYYHAMSRALRAAQQPTIIPLPRAAAGSNSTSDAAPPAARNWRDELIDAITARQRPDGSWINDESRWMENEPELTTIYAVLALQECLKPLAAE